MIYLIGAVPILLCYWIIYGAVRFFCAAQWPRLIKTAILFPILIITLGVGLNATVIIANHGKMPTIASVYNKCLPDHIHCELTPASRLPLLADITIIRGGNGAMSLGDICNDIGHLCAICIYSLLIPVFIIRKIAPLFRNSKVNA